ncbi:Hypothetical_protein [Hexamita inflata]|uniref:Hypothetical_protein n=1 Tax=Hexamita inflata TaxID=28002 RepID=A0AA86NSX8_9EUKA|nr:Hypothetical protein HINF_LOCUS13105 [Hexamita inflata]
MDCFESQGECIRHIREIVDKTCKYYKYLDRYCYFSVDHINWLFWFLVAISITSFVAVITYCVCYCSKKKIRYQPDGYVPLSKVEQPTRNYQLYITQLESQYTKENNVLPEISLIQKPKVRYIHPDLLSNKIQSQFYLQSQLYSQLDK